MSNPDRYADDLCERCGRCCYQKLWIEDDIYYLPSPCEYLDTRTKLCTVYDRRHVVNPQCLSVENGIKFRVFPADCPYVRNLPGYVPPMEDVLDASAVRLIREGKIASSADLRRHAARHKAQH